MSTKRNIARLKFGTNFAIFVIFFGIATLEAFQRGNIYWSIFWVVMGLLFLIADNFWKIKKNKDEEAIDQRRETNQ